MSYKSYKSYIFEKCHIMSYISQFCHISHIFPHLQLPISFTMQYSIIYDWNFVCSVFIVEKSSNWLTCFTIFTSTSSSLISEGTERLAVALSSGQVVNAIPAQALLQSGNKLLKDCRHELELINQVLAGSHHEPNKAAAASTNS